VDDLVEIGFLPETLLHQQIHFEKMLEILKEWNRDPHNKKINYLRGIQHAGEVIIVPPETLFCTRAVSETILYFVLSNLFLLLSNTIIAFLLCDCIFPHSALHCFESCREEGRYYMQ
jgi:hypothetical protein